MDLKFDSISIEGFRSFQKRSVIRFEPGLHYVRGRNLVEPTLDPNGAGKSSIFHALSWVLYGKCPGNLKSPDIKPWVGADTRVSVRIGDVKITRTLDPNQLLLNNEQTSQEAVIEALGGISYELFSHTILLGQGEDLFFDLQPKDKMQLFSDVLKLTRWEDRAEAARNRVAQLITTQMSLTGELSGIEGVLLELADLKARLERQRKEWEDEQATKSKNIDKDIRKLQKELDENQARLDTASLALDSAGTERKALQNEADKADEIMRKANEDFERARLQLENKSERLTALKRQLAQLENNKKCPTCGQPVKQANLSEHRGEIKKELIALSKEVDAGIPQSAEDSYDKAFKRIQQIAKHVQAFREKEDKALANVDFLKPTVVELVTKIKQLKERAREETQNPYLEQLQLLRRKRSKLEGQREEVQHQLNKTASAIERAKYWVKGFKDVRLFIIDEVLDELELATNTMLEEIGLVGWSVQYAIEKETKSGTFQRGLNVTIKSPGNDEPVKWECWSGGEGQRLRLIGALALSEVLLNEANVNPNLEILDEPSRGLARKGVNDLVSILSWRASTLGKSIFYVDHQVMESSNFTSTITVVKDSEGSYIQS